MEPKYFVYPGHGVVELKRSETKMIKGVLTPFYHFRVVSNMMSIVVPHEHRLAVGLRELTSEKKLASVLRLARRNDLTPNPLITWNRRYREYMERIKTGDIYEIAEVYARLRGLQKNKDLSFGERKMLDQAKHLLETELNLVSNERIEL